MAIKITWIINLWRTLWTLRDECKDAQGLTVGTYTYLIFKDYSIYEECILRIFNKHKTLITLMRRSSP